MADMKEVRLIVPTCSRLYEVKGIPVPFPEMPGVGLVLRETPRGWQVDEVSTGRVAATGRTKSAVIAQAKRKFMDARAHVEIVLMRDSSELRERIATEPRPA